MAPRSFADPADPADPADLDATEVVNDEKAVDHGNHNLEWEDGPTSWDEFGHDNSPELCGLRRMTAKEWEDGRHWNDDAPIIVSDVTDGWAALTNWKKQEMLRLYPDAEATMGDGRRVGEIGPDDAGMLLSPTTVEEFVTEHMYDPFKYFFDRKIAIPRGMLEDCKPFPMPTRAYLEDPHADEIYAQSKKLKVNPKPDREIWRDHLAVSIGADLRGLSLHHHGAAWNAVIFGKKRWIMYDPARWQNNVTLQRFVALERPDAPVLSSPEWIRRLYGVPERLREIRDHGHDCVQHAGEMMFVPRRWMHMVINIGDTVSVISEVGLERGEGKKPEDFLFDPFEESSSDDDDGESEDWSSDDDDEESEDDDDDDDDDEEEETEEEGDFGGRKSRRELLERRGPRRGAEQRFHGDVEGLQRQGRPKGRVVGRETGAR